MSCTLTKVLIGGNGYGCNNLGDDAILIAIVDHLKRSLPDTLITVLAGEAGKLEKRLGVRVVNLRRRYAFREIAGTDIFIGGGGPLFAEELDNRQPWWLGRDYPFYPLSLIQLATMLGKKVVVCGVGAGSLRSKPAKLLTSPICNKASLITVRDTASKVILAELGVKENLIHVTADPAFLLEPSNGVNICDFFTSIGGLNEKDKIVGLIVANENIVGLSEYKRELAKAADYLVKKHQVKILFIPMNVKPWQDPQGIQDILSIISNKDHIGVISDDLEPAQVLKIISQLDLLISMRFHALVFAVIGNTPVIGVGRTFKMQPLFDFLGLDYLISEGDLGTKKLIYYIDEVLEQHLAIKKTMKQKFEALKEQALLNFILLKKEIHNRGRA